jgi:adenylate kinase
MFNIVIFGAPGSGKGTQSENLINHYGLQHISTGDLLRSHIAEGSELGKLADSYISRGQLIPDDLMLSILDAHLDKLGTDVEGVIFDGFPRTIPQAEALEKILQKRGTGVHAVVGLEVPEDQLMERMIKRGATSGRSDDNPATIAKRLEVYHSQTSPLKEFYTGCKLYHAIDGTGTIDEIFARIAAVVDPLKNA